MPKPKPFLYLALLGLLAAGTALAFSGCAAGPSPAPSAQPPLGTSIFIPGPALPVLAGTPVPMPREPISPANVSNLRELAIWGKGRISQVSYSPDGQLLAVGTAAGIWLYDAQSMAELRFIETERAANTLIFAPDGQTLTAVLSTTTLSTWNIASGQRLDSIAFKQPIKTDFYWANPDYAVGSVSSPDGITLAAMTDLSHIGLWNTKSGNQLHVVNAGGIDGLHHLALASNRTLLAAAYPDDIVLWDMKQGTQSQRGIDRQYNPLAFSPDGKLLSNGTELWDVPGLEPRCTLENRPIAIGSVTFSPDGRLLAVGSMVDGTIKVWEVDTCRLRHNLAGHRAEIFSLAFSPDGSRLASGSRDGTLRQWDTRTGTSLNEMEGFWPGIRDLAVAPDGTLFISPAFDNSTLNSYFERTIYRQDLRTGQVVGVLKRHMSDAALALSADGRILVSSEWMGNSTLVWDMKTGQRLRDLGFATGTMALSPDGSKLATGITDGKRTGLSILDMQTGKVLYIVTVGMGINAAFSPDGSKLAAIGGGRAEIFDSGTGESLYKLEGGGPLDGFPIFSPDSKTVAAQDNMGSIWLWDAGSRQLIYRLKHPSDARYVAYPASFLPDGRLLASGTSTTNPLAVFQPSIYLWDTRQGTLLNALPNYMANVARLAFSPDGKLLISGALDGTVRLWGIVP